MVKKAQLCTNEKLSDLVSEIQKSSSDGRKKLDVLLIEYPDEPRLHFLKGSLLAAKQDYVAARAAMRHAVNLAPDYDIARFQLGFLLLTSGEPHAAQEAWGPLHALPESNYLNIFVRGLCHLIRDEFEDAIRLLEGGIERNHDNLPMNADMKLIIDEVRRKQASQDSGSTPSAVDQLLQQSALRSTRH